MKLNIAETVVFSF